MYTPPPQGGFFPSSLPSPAPSSALSSATISHSLPQQRHHPLKPGSSKETAVINYVDSHILAINRRHAKKFSSSFSGEKDEDRGYERFREVAKDIEGIADVLWVSGTPSLQTPYLISIAGLLNTYLPDYPFSPRSTFRLVRKLDAMFASLLQGEDVETGQPLPGFETRRNQVSMTEKVRIKSIAESTRITILDTQDQGGPLEFDIEDEDGDGNEARDDDGDFGTGEFVADSGPGRWEMESAKVYERTIQLLGDELGKQGGF
ncbi:ribosomal RNA-processing protein 7 [Coccidioides immitis RS]|uniref:Ribosomal RNA-processing protein 7 n=3 Tax=Coccidioides immitis TaxID=5501 RepID=A0A0D8JUT0_COCIM|nr:ribosomal RNA-processing protein 7 [Coccidioides immitis RS]KJF60899.1 ribosomal RNA-processing protein 7 [Coccidioides immitis RS]KMP06138.1 hypothetical protein CIRG_05819 [Coccidioides immitis RMSCC 2394]TPX22827.1 Ribosomal RNA-processing protein 7 [Coccidioides immitis]